MSGVILILSCLTLVTVFGLLFPLFLMRFIMIIAIIVISTIIKLLLFYACIQYNHLIINYSLKGYSLEHYFTLLVFLLFLFWLLISTSINKGIVCIFFPFFIIFTLIGSFSLVLFFVMTIVICFVFNPYFFMP